MDMVVTAPFGWIGSSKLLFEEVAYYPDAYFNLDRRHSALAYHSPHQFECDCLASIS
jgi:hypothetical protein